MTPYTSHLSVVAVAADRDLARKAAASLLQPHKTSKQIVEDLLERLQSIRRRRDLRGLNHWSEFAPTYLHYNILGYGISPRAAASPSARRTIRIF